jgi:2-oxoglutarate ferredoxin oxidoreductase subunit alpha
VFVVEQNRDAQLRTLLVNECGSIRPAGAVLHYDGTPITARFIAGAARHNCGDLETAVPCSSRSPGQAR